MRDREGTANVGMRLRGARERRGLALRDVSNITKISVTALRAMERNEFGRLPGGVFRKAYVRAVADAVGLDADELARDYNAIADREPGSDLPSLELSASNDRSPRWRPYAALLLAMLVMLYGWLLSNRSFSTREALENRSTPVSWDVESPERTAPTYDSDRPL